jgi:hypothetical protein
VLRRPIEAGRPVGRDDVGPLPTTAALALRAELDAAPLP